MMPNESETEFVKHFHENIDRFLIYYFFVNMVSR